ncbi:MAG: response regulator, partial [Acidobacteria bacterium]|nr:response regulator [Acidobacteriota bacterium]
ATMSSPVRILVADDHISVRRALRSILELEPGCEVVGEATDGQQAVTLAEELQPDVILMDINLPGISGLEALTILRDDEATAHIPVVALSANAMPRDIQKGLEAGFLCYLTKPIRVKEFMDALNEALAFVDTHAAKK